MPFHIELLSERNALRGVTFLSLNKKVTKEVSLGESAQASLRQFAPSPKNPSRNSGVVQNRLSAVEDERITVRINEADCQRSTQLRGSY